MIEAHRHQKWGFKKGNDLWKKMKFTDEVRRKLREARAKRIITDETRKKLSEALIGKKKSEEHREKLSLAGIGKGMGEKNPWWKGGKIFPIGKGQLKEEMVSVWNVV